MKQFKLHLMGISLFSVAMVLQAQESAQSEATVDRIVKEEAGQQVEETRIDGRLESIRVKPRIGPEYFIDDRSGDGTLSSAGGGEMDSQFNIRTWKLGEW